MHTSFRPLARLRPLAPALLFSARTLAAILCVSVGAMAQQAPGGFNVYEYVVDGNSLLDEGAIAASMAPFLGESKSLKDVEGARAALEKTYHDAGYLTVLVAIPEQSVDGGAVALHVVEAGIDKLRIKGAQYTLPSAIRAQVPELAEGKVPNFNKVQEQLSAVNRNGNVRVTPILRAGTVPGTVEVQLDAEDQLPLHGSVDVSNRQTPNTTATRVGASLRYDNLWQRGHSFGMTLQTAPQRPTDARVLAANYMVPVSASGAALMVTALHSRSEFASLANSPGLGALGNSDIVGLRYSVPLGASTTFSHSLTAGLDHKRVGQSLTVNGSPGKDSAIHYSPVVASYMARASDARGSTAVDLNLSAGLRSVLNNRDEAFNASRPGASASFLAVRATLARTQMLGNWSVFGRLDGQLASGSLVSSEQYSAGGAESVRGYLESERSADSGARLNLELRSPSYRPFGPSSDWAMTGLVFFDMARLSIHRPTAPQTAHSNLRGAGVGMRLSTPHGGALELDAAHPLVDGDLTRAGDNRIHARAVWSF